MRLRRLLLWIGAFASLALAQPPAFITTASLTTPRAGHTATLLLNGKVLIAGGSPNGSQDPLVSAELYDPATSAFIPTGAMTSARTLHSATLLADGRVLLAGGRGPIVAGSGAQDLADAELYDPNTDAFTPAGRMITLRGQHNATLLADGRVLVTGCAIPCNSAIAEVYNPATGIFSDAGSPGAGGDTATLLPSGSVLTTGGCPADFHGTKAQLFDPGTGAFSFTGPMTNGCGDTNTATLLMNGKVLFAGNDGNDGFPGEAELFEPVAGTFTSLGHTIGPHQFSAATLISDGTVLITGGQLPGGNGDTGAELYVSTTGTFALAGKMSAGRHSHSATLLPDGSVLIAGGYAGWPSATASVEIYRPAVLQRAPVLLSLAGGQGAVLHAGTSRVASPEDPASSGEILEIYCTGLSEGSVIPPRVILAGRTAEVVWFGNAPGYQGLNQINVRVATGVAPGRSVPMRLNYLTRPSNEVTIGVR